MVDMIIAAAALTAATSQDAKLLAQAAEAQSPSGDAVRSAVPAERRRVARATTTKADYAALKPLLERAKVDASLSETRTLLDKAERQLTNGHREQAMLTLDGANLQLERARPDATGANSNFIDSFLELERRESSLREKLGQPGFVPLKSAPSNKKPDAAPQETAPSKEEEPAPAKPVRDELPVG